MEKLTAIELSQYILAKLGAMPHLKLQKLIYYVEAYHLAYFDGISIIDDDFEAWVHGPALRSLWHHYKGDSILYNDIQIDKTEASQIIKVVKEKLTQDQLDLIDDVLAEYGNKSAYYLECLTHEETPWKEARKNIPFDENSQVLISKETMKTYYFELMYT